LIPIAKRVTMYSPFKKWTNRVIRLFKILMTHQERAYFKSSAVDQVWGGNVYVEERTVDVHIRRFTQKPLVAPTDSLEYKTVTRYWATRFSGKKKRAPMKKPIWRNTINYLVSRPNGLRCNRP